MRTLLSACVLLALALPSAAAQQRYDRKLEDAVKAIVAAKIGDIRGGFALDAKPVMVRPGSAVADGTMPVLPSAISPVIDPARLSTAY